MVGKLNLPETTTKTDELILPFSEKKRVILSKLPIAFQRLFNQYSKYHKQAASLGELYEQLTNVGSKYSGSWDACHDDDRDSQDSPTQLYPSYQTEHARTLRKKKN